MDDPEYYLDFHAQLNEQRRAGDMCDVKITSRGNDTGKGNEFMAHMNVLSAASPHFKRVFHSGFKEAIVGEVKLDMDTDIVEFLLEYIYTSKAEIDESIASRLLPEAAYLQLDRLKERCANSLIVVPEFLGLDKTDLLSLLTDKSLRCRESSVFSGVCNWVRADPENRKQHMKELFSLVRLLCLKKDYLVDTVGKEPLVTEDKMCFQIYLDCIEGIARAAPDSSRNRGLTWKASGEWTDGPQLGVNMNYCSSIVFDGKIYCASRANQMAVLSQGNWRLIAPPSTGPTWKLCVVSNSMYAIGVVSGNRNVYKFEKGSETWTLVHSAQRKSGDIVAVTSLDDRICVADKSTKIIETFDTNNAGSVFVRLCAFPPGLSHGFALCVTDGRLMTVGGRMNNTFKNQVYVWDPQTDSWNAGKPIGEVRGYLGATVCDGPIVIAGGYNGVQNQQHVQMLVDGEWKQLPSLKRARCDCGVAVLDNVLYAIGGYHTPTVEMLRFEEE